MGLHKRTELGPLLEAGKQGKRKQVYLFFGERYLCRQAAVQLEDNFLAQGGGSIHALDGAVEDSSKLLARLLSLTLLPGLQLYRVVDTNLFHSREVGKQIWDKACTAMHKDKSQAASRHLINLLKLGSVNSGSQTVFSDISVDQWSKLFGFAHPGQDLVWADKLVGGAQSRTAPAKDPLDKLMAAIKGGLPGNNLLLLMAEHVDKRKKLFTHIKKYGEIIDCSVAEGSSRAAVQQQKDVIREMVNTTLRKMNKSIEPRALEMLFERVGFHPVGAVLEIEKLALFVDERQRITIEDLEQMVGRIREDAIFELTEALGNNNSSRTMIVFDHLLSDGVHGLAIIASLRNYLRRLLIFRSLQKRPQPPWSANLSSSDFQKIYLPALKETEAWPDLLKGHPYALYMGFSKASQFAQEKLKQSLSLLLEAEFKLKGSPVPGRIVLEELLMSLLKLLRPTKTKTQNLSAPYLKTV